MRARFAVTTILLLLASCGPSKETSRDRRVLEGDSELSRYEADFRPSDYDPDIHILLKESRDSIQQPTPTQPGSTPPQTLEVLAGFRVQLFSSADIVEANAKKAEAETLFPGEWIYLVYDPPTYRIRAGNFLARFEADRFLKLATERGYRDAWIVPGKVYKNPPPPPPPPNDQTIRK